MQHRKNPDRDFIRTKRRGRLIIRNLPFSVDEDILKKAFSQFGAITDVDIPKKKDGTSRGFAFICFGNRNQSCNAVKEMNGADLCGRVIAVDHSIPKKLYQDPKAGRDESETLVQDNVVSQVLERALNAEKTIATKDQPVDSDYKPLHEEISKDEACLRKLADHDHDHDIENDNENEDMEYGSDESDKLEKMSDTTSTSSRKKTRTRKSRDAKEGRTVFIKNISFDTTDHDLKTFMENFGSVEYTVLCRDPDFDHPKGTAFTKFKNKKDAEKCLKEFEQDKDKFSLNDRRFEVCLALTRGAVKSIQEKKRTKPRDKRNIYLAKEGLIYPDSPAAEGMSQADLTKRLQLETRKRAMLNNLLNFVSRNRLCVHNLPESVTDKDLKKLFLGAVDDPKAQILEAKVIRNVKAKGEKLGKSTGFGFVTFKRHTDALKALRRLNNNPQVFTTSRRPIVEFSVEKVLAVKKKRKNDQHYLEDEKDNDEEIIDEELPYMGVKATPFKESEPIVLPKVSRKIFENWTKLKERGKKLKKEKKLKKQLKEMRQNRERKLLRKAQHSEKGSTRPKVKDNKKT